MSKKEETLIIENTRAALVELPGIVDKEGTVQQDGVKLIPGENDVPVKEWNRVKNHKTVKMYMAPGIGILIEKGPGRARKLSDGLDSLEKHEALLQIAKCNHVQILQDWAGKTKDDFLIKKCRSRIDEIVKTQGSEGE
jgi:hypothetical protein